jgi:hypothetical protein
MDHTCKKTPSLDTSQPIVIGNEWDDFFILVSFAFFFLITKKNITFRSWARKVHTQDELTFSSQN